MFTRDRFQTDPNGCGPKIGLDRPPVYIGPFWNGSGAAKNWACFSADHVQFCIRPEPVPERSRVNRIRSGPVRFGTGVRSGPVGYVYTGPGWNRSEPNWTGSASVCTGQNGSKRIQNWTCKKQVPGPRLETPRALYYSSARYVDLLCRLERAEVSLVARFIYFVPSRLTAPGSPKSESVLPCFSPEERGMYAMGRQQVRDRARTMAKFGGVG